MQETERLPRPKTAVELSLEVLARMDELTAGDIAEFKNKYRSSFSEKVWEISSDDYIKELIALDELSKDEIQTLAEASDVKLTGLHETKNTLSTLNILREFSDEEIKA